MAKLDDTRLEAIISSQIQLAKSHDTKERQADRAKAIDYYFGNMDRYVPPEPNRSRVVSRDVADTIGWMLPGIIRVYTASDRMAMAEPVGTEDEQFAREATDGMNYVFWKDNRGYEIVYDVTWDALLFGNGIVKTYYDETPIYTSSFHSGLTEDQLTLLLSPEGDGEAPEVLQKDERDYVAPDPETGEAVRSKVYDVKIKRKKAEGKFVVEAIAPDHFLIHGDATRTDDAAFTAHWDRKMRTELVEMGYDLDDVRAIPASARIDTPEEVSRHFDQESEDAADSSTELVDYYECFIRIDVDDDGEAELIRACMGGADNGKLLHWEVWEDENPFDDIPCEPVPHRWTARSIADETMDVQDIKTVLSRQALNNVYATNNPQRFVTGEILNVDELYNPTFGGTVHGKTGATLMPIEVPFVANHAFEAIHYQDEVIQRRTGVSRQGQALDPETLQNQTATAAQQQQDASYSQVELVARNMAEYGWRKVFRKLMRLMIKHQGPRRLMMSGKPIQIDPRHWNADMDVTINVGLGTGSRDRDLIMLRQVLETQMLMADRFMAAGAMNDAIDMLPKILRTMTKMAESAGIRNPEEFYPEYTEEKVAQLKQLAEQKAQQGDPKIALEKEKLQADMQRSQAEMQMDAQRGQVEMQMDAAKNEQDIQLQREKIQGELALKQYQIQAEMELKREQLILELQLKQQLSMAEMDMKKEAGFYSADRQAEVGKYKADATSKVHVGGDPG
jgi:hypothetical protein